MSPYRNPAESLWDEYPKHYLEKRELTIQLGLSHPTMNTVIEFNSWEGKPDQDDANIERTRHTVLLDHDNGYAILCIQRGLIAGDPKLLDALCRLNDLYEVNPDYQVVLSYDLRLGMPVFQLRTD